ncbi:hypothetical protein ACOQFO_06715 [Ureibacillus sp. MALMAid1270]|uniref:hypothetical protein n=1 Tax=Ureibacillus sp. MALMAid1270 TaxID=3411629 RepID=UPI003BA57969
MNSQHIIVEKRTNTAASLSLFLSITGFILGIIPIIGLLITTPFCLLAIIFGIVGLFKEYKRRTAIIGIVIAGLSFFYHFQIMSSLVN